MPTNPPGKGTRNIGVNMPDELLNEIQELANRSGMSRNRYIRTVLEKAASNGWLTIERRHVVRETAPAEAPGTVYHTKKKVRP